MKRQNHYPRVKSGVKLDKDTHQYNSIVSFITSTDHGVAGTNLTEYEELVQKFTKLLRKIDPRYSKLQARGKSFPKVVFNRPSADFGCFYSGNIITQNIRVLVLL